MSGSFFNTWCVSRSSYNSDHAIQYWCYHCDKQVINVENQGDDHCRMVCKECKSSFLESNSNDFSDNVASDASDSPCSCSEDDNESDEDESSWMVMLKLNTLDRLITYENRLSRLGAEEKETEDENHKLQHSHDIQSLLDARINRIRVRICYLESCWGGQQRQGLVSVREIKEELENLRENEYLYFSGDVYEDDDSDNDDGGGRKGAPPAAESAVAALQNIRIELEEEALVCAVCQDLVNVGETAKDL